MISALRGIEEEALQEQLSAVQLVVDELLYQRGQQAAVALPVRAFA